MASASPLGDSHHPELAPTLNNLATLLKQQGHLVEAGILYRRTLALLERTVEPDHPTLLACRANYQRIHQTTAACPAD